MSIAGVFGPIYASILYAIWPGYHAIILFAVGMSLLAFVVFHLPPGGPQETMGHADASRATVGVPSEARSQGYHHDQRL